MNLDTTMLNFIKQVLRTAHLFKCEDFVIEKGYVRGWNTERTVVIADTNVPQLPFEGIGFNRVATLLNRLALLEQYDITLESKNGFVMGLVIKSSAATLRYKCANPSAIRTPKNIHDLPIWQIEFSPADIELLQRARGVMGAAVAKLESVDGAFTVSFEDADRDTYVQNVIGHIENIGGVNDSLSFVQHYDVVTLLTAMKNADSANIKKGPDGSIIMTMGKSGNLVMRVNGIVINVCPMAISKRIM